MSLPVLLFLSLWTVQCGGRCDSDLDGVRNIKTTIDMNAIGFRSVFPKDYTFEHHYNRNILCDNPCCVFPAAIVLLDSWHVLNKNLYDEHINRSLIQDLKQTLERIIRRNIHTEWLQEETDFNKLSTHSSSPEELLNLTSELFSRWIEVRCDASIHSCRPPTLLSQEKRQEGVRTTRGVDENEPVKLDRKDPTQVPSSGGRLSVPYSVSLCSPLLFRLYWWLLA